MRLLCLLSAEASSSGDGAAPPSSFDFKQILIWVLIIGLVVAWVFMNTRNRKKQQQAIEEKMGTLAVGDIITTIGMICGTVVKICEDGTVVLKTGDDDYPGYIRIDKQGIYRFNKADENLQEPFGEMSDSDGQLQSAAQEQTQTLDNSETTELETEEQIETAVKEETAKEIELTQAKLKAEDTIVN